MHAAAPLRFGGDEEDRTPGLGIANAALSQLSYIPGISFGFRVSSYELLTDLIKNSKFSPYVFQPELHTRNSKLETRN